MKVLGKIRMRFMAAILLCVGLVLLIFLNIMERRNIGQIDKFFTSIYNDRLIPATDIFYIMENLYNKRLTMEKYLFSEENLPGFTYEDLKIYDNSIDSLIVLFEKTYLVANEYKCLNNFKMAVSDYSKVENNILLLINTGSTEEAQKIFKTRGSDTFSAMIKNLHELTIIQSSVGEEIIKSSQTMLSHVNIGSKLEIVLVIFIVVAVQLIIATRKNLNFPYQKFNLN
ncbi:hypothetical protein BH23BAC1_BH23BAC1_47470 [soil metagenome]